jgi:flagella synthesis protein FlgN
MVSLSTATTDQAAMLLREEAAQYTLLLGILKAEQQALAQGALEDISRISEEKAQRVADINILEKQRQSLSDNQNSKQHPALADLWQNLSNLAQQARELNLANGRLINTRLQRTQDALAILRTDNERDPTYGPDGQASASGSGRPLASA